MKKHRPNYTWPMLITRDVIGGKWKLLILWRLHKGTKRYSELKNDIPKITSKMLTSQLRELENDEIIHRKVYPVVPPKVEYSLTPLGNTLIPVLSNMANWGTHYRDTILMKIWL